MLMRYQSLNPNRPWDLPSNRWIMRQDWHDAFFLNAKIDKNILQGLIPSGLTLDLFNGQAYISIIPFKMNNISFRYLPFFKPSAYDQINIRTYVIRDGKPGVYFLSLDSAHPSLSQMIKMVCDIPLIQSSIHRIDKDQATHLDLDRKGLQLYLNVSKDDSKMLNATKGSFEYWISERYCFYNNQNGQITRWEVDHKAWPLFPAKLHNLSINHGTLNLAGLDFSQSCYYSPGVSTRAWPPAL
jgi:uncharacterized protein YqjF (DUF2071 family)